MLENIDDGHHPITELQIRSIGKNELSRDDISILHELEKKNQITYKDTYVSEFLKCRNNIFYFIHNYVNIGEVGNPRLYTPDMMNRKYRRVIKSLHKYRKVILMASRQLGKALDLDTPIPLFNGQWKTMRELQIGDQIIDDQGKPTKVVQQSPIFKNQKCYKVFFDNQSSVICSEDHLWTFSSEHFNLNNTTQNTGELKKILDFSLEQLVQVPFIHINKPIHFPKKDFSIPPYILGVWLGIESLENKKLNLSPQDNQDLTEEMNQYSFSTYHPSFNFGGRIPEEYFSGSIYQRLQLLRGLMDVGGYISDEACEFCRKDKNLIDDIVRLLSSLGIKSSKRTKIDSEIHYVVRFLTKHFYVFNLKRKRQEQKKLKVDKDSERLFVVRIDEVQTRETKCIMVDSPSKLFLCGKSLIPTHNSTLAASIIAHALTFFPGIKCVMFNMDMTAGTENISKVKFVLQNLPEWMRFIPNNCLTKTYIQLTNDSAVSVVYPSTIKTPSQLARSLTIPCLYVDEAAFIRYIDQIWMSAQPTLSTASGQALKYGYPTWSLMTSTPNGTAGIGKFFYDYWRMYSNTK